MNYTDIQRIKFPALHSNISNDNTFPFENIIALKEFK